MKCILVKVDDDKYEFTFRTFYGRSRKRKANETIKYLISIGIKAEII